MASIRCCLQMLLLLRIYSSTCHRLARKLLLLRRLMHNNCCCSGCGGVINGCSFPTQLNPMMLAIKIRAGMYNQWYGVQLHWSRVQ
jgi:hypothetical protein